MSKSRDIADSADVINFLDGVSSSVQSQINSKAPIASPSFTGQVSLNGTAITALATELNYTDGVTSNIQDQFNSANAKAIAIALVFGA